MFGSNPSFTQINSFGCIYDCIFWHMVLGMLAEVEDFKIPRARARVFARMHQPTYNVITAWQAFRLSQLSTLAKPTFPNYHYFLATISSVATFSKDSFWNYGIFIWRYPIKIMVMHENSVVHDISVILAEEDIKLCIPLCPAE